VIRAAVPLLRALLPALLVLLAFAGGTGAARAAPSYDNCTGFLDPHPEQFYPEMQFVNQPGIWCLRQNLVFQFSDNTYGLIQVQGDDITIDCKGHRVEVVGGGQLYGVVSSFSQRTTVRNCEFRGFATAIIDNFNGGTPPVGDVAEDNVILDGSIHYPGVSHAMVRRNRLYGPRARIAVSGDSTVIDNLVDGTLAVGYGDAISLWDANGGEIRGNVVRNFRHDPADPTGGHAPAIRVQKGGVPGGRATVRDNVILGDGTGSTYALYCDHDTTLVTGNVINGVADSITGCKPGENDISP